AITYGDDPDAVVRDVLATLDAGAARAVAAGVPAGRVIVDPTLDFGKTTRHSLRVLRAAPGPPFRCPSTLRQAQGRQVQGSGAGLGELETQWLGCPAVG
ncbi:MAG: dihydropteroate synthase, partial [Actinobacteria bacterium]|nr:dihydropteroate synthase [Actinomycetota bacterium]